MATLGTFVTGQVLTAAELNAIGTYTAYTPTWTNVTVGNGTNAFAYTQINKMVHVFGKFTLGSTSAITGLPIMSLPVNRNIADLAVLGSGSFQDVGVKTYAMFPLSNAVGTALLFSLGTAGAVGDDAATSATVPFTWGNTDVIQVNLIYRAA